MKSILILLFLFISSVSIAQPYTSLNLTDKEKLYGLSLLWKEADYNFAYWKRVSLDWDSAYQSYIPKVLQTRNTYEYYRVLQHFLALLKDAHTDIGLPPNMWKIKGDLTTSFITFRHDDRWYVMNVAKKDSVLIPRGSEVLQRNGVPVQDYVNNEIVPYASHSMPHQLSVSAFMILLPRGDTSEVELKIKKPSGEIVNYKTKSSRRPGGSAYKHVFVPNGRFMTQLTDGIIHLQLNGFGSSGIVDLFRGSLHTFYKARGIIIDLRNNGGGNTQHGIDILKYFTEDKLLKSSSWKTPSHHAAFKAWGKAFSNEYLIDTLNSNPEEKQWKKTSRDVRDRNSWYYGKMEFINDVRDKKIKCPVVILTGHNTGSAAEVFIVAAQNMNEKTTIVGDHTRGSTGQPLHVDLPGGGFARICTKANFYPDGREFAVTGIQPDIKVTPSLNDILEGKDVVLNKAIDVIKMQMKN